MFNFTFHVCTSFSHGEHRCASQCWCSPTRHTSSVSPPVSATPSTLQTEMEENGRPPSSNVRAPYSEDWEHHLLWWRVHRQHWNSQAGVPVQSQTRHMVTSSHLLHCTLWSHPAEWEASDSGRWTPWSDWHPHQWCLCISRIWNMGELHHPTAAYSSLLPNSNQLQINTSCNWRTHSLAHWQ